MKPLVSALVVLLALAACLPDPQSVKERREKFPRNDLRGEYIFDSTPAGLIPVGAEFGKPGGGGGHIKLVGYALEPKDPKAPVALKVTLYWTALAPITEDYQVFVHGDAIGGNAARLHGDHFPADGKYGTDVWQSGEIVADPFTIRVPPGYGPKTLGLYIGLYLGNYRVPLTNRGSAESDNENRTLIKVNLQ